MPLNKNKQQTCIFVLGMHRSGTSALTGVLDILGVELGSELLQPWSDNPKGFFENERIWRFNQNILESFGSSWDDPFLFGHEWCAAHGVNQYRAQAEEILEQEFSAADVFAIKDPRMCILFPFWSSVCEEIGVRAVCILPCRHPVEVAGSLTNRNGFSRQRGLLLWLNYVITAEKVSRSHPRLFLRFDDLFQDYGNVLEMFTSTLEVQFPKSISDARQEVEIFLDAGLKHQSASQFGTSEMECMVEEMYGLLQEISPGQTTPSWQKSVDNLGKRYQALRSFFYDKDLPGTYNCLSELESLKMENEILSNEREKLSIEMDRADQQLKRSDEKIRELQRQIERITGTRAWRVAEKVRRVTGYKKKRTMQ